MKMELEKIDNTIYYLDEWFIVIKFDKLNLAILDRSKFEKADRTSKAVLGYYGNLQQVLISLSELLVDKKLSDKKSTKALFEDLDTFTYTFIAEKKEILKSIVRTLESNLDDDKEEEIKFPIGEIHEIS